MTDILEVSSLIAILSALVATIIYGVMARLKIKNLSRQSLQDKIDNNYLRTSLGNALLEIESKKLEETDGFINFISESRDQAFKYIEQIEESFEELDLTMQRIFQWDDSYGSANGTSAHTEAISEIKQAYEKYKSNMPNNTNNK